MTQYGAPVVILNLVKKKEKYRKHESLLADYMHDTVNYLNTFLHEENHLHYTHFDMARCRLVYFRIIWYFWHFFQLFGYFCHLPPHIFAWRKPFALYSLWYGPLQVSLFSHNLVFLALSAILATLWHFFQLFCYFLSVTFLHEENHLSLMK